MLTAEIAMMSASPFQVRVVPPVELDRPLDGVVAGRGIRRRGRPPFPGRARLGNRRRHGCHPRKVTVVMVVLLVMVIVVVIVHVQVRRGVQPRAGHRLVLGAAGLRRLHLDVGHLERLVVERGEHVWVHHLVHLEPRRLLRLVRVVQVPVRDRVHRRPAAHPGRLEEVAAHDRLVVVSGFDHVLLLIVHHQSLQHRIEVGGLQKSTDVRYYLTALLDNAKKNNTRRC